MVSSTIAHYTVKVAYLGLLMTFHESALVILRSLPRFSLKRQEVSKHAFSNLYFS